MAGEGVRFKISAEEKERITERADELGFSRAEYIRQRFRAGELLWNSGELDRELLTRMKDNDEPQEARLEDAEQGGSSDTQQASGEHPASPNESLTEILLQNIPHKDTGNAVSDQELKDAIFGSEDDRETAIKNAIKELFGDKITRRHDGLLVRTGD